jgi:acetyl esterase/lipase
MSNIIHSRLYLLLKYSRTYRRALRILNTLDAGFLAAMKFKNPTLRHVLSVFFVLYYFLNSDQVTDKIYKSWRTATISSIRVCWDKGIHPLNRLRHTLFGPKLHTIRQIRIPRKHRPDDHITAWIYYYDTLNNLKKETSMVMQFPGGGFVAIPTPCHESYLIYLAALLKVPIVSIDYRKAPEYPYPNGLDDCFDAYVAIVSSYGKVLGMNAASPEIPLNIAYLGDSSGGNLATGVIYRCIERTTDLLPLPLGIVLCYPTLNLAPTFWLSPEYYEEGTRSPQLSSLAKYVNDDILVPNLIVKMMSAYLTEGCDPTKDIYLSPLLADEILLKQFPKTYIHCGSADPLSDDSLCFSKRLHQANPDQPAALHWFPNMSHGYMLLLDLLPETKVAVHLTAQWLAEILHLPSSTKR